MHNLSILIVDDDPADIEILLDYMDDAPFEAKVTTAPSGDAALAQLGAGDLPDLVLLDLNMPGKTGHQTLAEMRAIPRLAKLPVLVLTTSDQDKDIEQSFAGSANAFVTKPHNDEGFGQLLQLMADFADAYIWKTA